MKYSAEKMSAVFKGRTLDYYDEGSGYHIVVAVPAVEPELWAGFVAGAREAYCRHDVEAALEYDKIAGGESTVLFFAALAADGSVVGGSRALGPYRSAAEAHAMVEWSDPAHRTAIRRVLDEYIPSGLVEAKTGWVAPDVPRRRQLRETVARTTTYCMDLLDARYLVGTSADNTLEMWRHCGARVLDEIPPCSYPDALYRTRLLLWDVRRCDSEERRRTLAKLSASDSAPAAYAPTKPGPSISRGVPGSSNFGTDGE